MTITRQIPPFTLERQNRLLKEQYLQAIGGVIDSGKFILGKNVQALEEEIASYCGAPHAVGTASGSDALYLALLAGGVGPGSEVITTPFTFYATAGAIQRTGATPVFADIEPDTWNINPVAIKEKITERTRAILPVHLYGCPADMDAITDIAADHDLYVVEDAAQALGACYRGREVGTLGHAACFSFFPTKNLGSFGDGGMVVTGDPDIAQKIRALRVHGSTRKYHHDLPGCNSRLDEIHAAILRVKLQYLDVWTEMRWELSLHYIMLLSASGLASTKMSGARHPAATDPLDNSSAGSSPLSPDTGQTGTNGSAGNESNQLVSPYRLRLPIEPPYARHVYHQFTIQTPNREQLQQYLKEKGVHTTVYYPVPMHLQPVFASLNYRKGDFPVTEQACREVLSLPMFPELKAEEVSYTAELIIEFLTQKF